MDYIEGLAKQASQITMYDIKSYYNQAKNSILNVSEMEAKVREATNDDPWGASSTLMQQIADGTQNFQQFNEIMPTIYSRFMEKEAREWRQIYKALTLLEFLIKNGSERVVDDARAHVSTIKMLRSFHYIDEKGKDQGINVRNRASEIGGLLVDVEKIRTERRKAKSNKTKFSGQGNDGGMSFVTSSGSRYGGFGSDSLGGGSSYQGGGSNYDQGASDEYRPSRNYGSSSKRGEYDEYEGADEFDDQPPRRGTPASGSTASASRSGGRPVPPPKKDDKPPVKEVNLFDFGDDEPAPAPASAVPQNILGGDDDFDDFQQAPNTSLPPTRTATAPAPKPAANANLFDMLNTTPAAPAPTPSMMPSAMASMPAMTARPSYSSGPMMSPPITTSPAKPVAPKSTFDDLFTSSLAGMGGNANSNKPVGRSMKDLEQEKASNKLWSSMNNATTTQANGTSNKASSGNGLGDLLF